MFIPLYSTGIAFAIYGLVSKKYFGIFAFVTTQLMLDFFPMAPSILVAIIAIAIAWKWENYGSIPGAIVGILVYPEFALLYQADIDKALKIYGNNYAVASQSRSYDAEIVGVIGWSLGILFIGVRKIILNTFRNR